MYCDGTLQNPTIISSKTQLLSGVPSWVAELFIGGIMTKIHLTQNKYTLIDDEDYELLSQRKWYAVKNGNTYYAGTWIKGITVFMHKVIMNPKSKQITHHMDGNGLNNQKKNLRLCTYGEHNQTKVKTNCISKYKGVWKSKKRWRATIYINGKPKNIGHFKNEKDAALAYNIAAVKRGEFTYLNKIH
jgi:hypothetical protein